MLAGSLNWCVVCCSLRNVFSVRVGFSGKIENLYDPVWRVRRPPPFLVYGLCEGFRVTESSVCKVVQVGEEL